jgi:hypothetical protein
MQFVNDLRTGPLPVFMLMKSEDKKKYRSDGKTERSCKQLLDDLKEKIEYLRLKQEALDRSVCRARFGIGYGLVVRQIKE